VRAPARGTLLHGKADALPGTGLIKRGDTLRTRRVFMVVGNPDTLAVTTDIPEDELLRMRSGAAVVITPVALPDLKLTGSARVDFLPSSRTGKGKNLYRAVVSFEKTDRRLRPGMCCKVTFPRRKDGSQ